MSDVFDMQAKLGLDYGEYKKGMDDAKGIASSVGGGIKNGLSGIANGIKVVGTAIGAAVAAASTGIGILTKAAVDGYGEYEQLKGGVDKLYGSAGMNIEKYAQSVGKSTDEVKEKYGQLQEATKIVMQNASEAYKNVGMSANEYMEIATGFSAALINSLGGDTVEAAKRTETAMRAISDNVNTFGSDMESVTNAFQAFSKQNYTLLDNLKLGYGGTKTEMERLIADANEWGKANGKASDLSIESFSDVVTAIEQIQEKQQIAGTTAREAAKTLQGSLSMLGGAWQNLIAGFANPDLNLDKLINNVVDAAETAMNNVMPVVERALIGIGTMLEKVAPIISQKLPETVEQFLPKLLNATTTLITTLIENAPELIASVAPTIISAFETVLDSLTEVIKNFFSKIPEWVSEIDWGELGEVGSKIGEAIVSATSSLAETGLTLAQQLADGMNGFDWAETATNICTWLKDAFSSDTATGFIEAGSSIIGSLASGIGQSIPELTTSAVDIVVGLVNELLNNSDAIVQGAIDLILGMKQGIEQGKTSIISAIPSLIGSLVEALIRNAPAVISAIIQYSVLSVQAIVQMFPTIINAVVQGIISLVQAVGNEGPQFLAKTGEILNSILTNITTWLSGLPSTVAHGVGVMVGRFITTLSTLIPKVVSKFNETMTKVKEFLKNFVEEAPKAAKKFVKELPDNLKSLPSKMKSAGKKIVDGLKEGIKNAWDSFISWIKQKALGIVGSFLDGVKEGAKGGDSKDKGGKSSKSASVSSLASISNADIETISNAFTRSNKKKTAEESGMDYEKLASAVVKAFEQSDFSMEVDGREFGRIVRKAVAY